VTVIGWVSAAPSARAAAGLAGGALAVGLPGAQLVPSVAAIGPLRRALLPGVCGVTARRHVALTFDDGPDPGSTPAVLDALAAAGLHATFFLLGSQLTAAPQLARRVVAEGHEVAVHSWTHRAHLLHTPAGTARELRRTRDLVAEVTGQPPRFWRPPYGIPTGAGLLAGRRLGMRAVLWTGDGRDWQAGATGESILARMTPHLRPGGVLLLHDSDVTSDQGSWRSAVAAVPLLAAACAERDLELGPLRDHGLP
jgi:peptidoglycan/xylan/chitin deacetylase (PgdA/CDA1 family)